MTLVENGTVTAILVPVMVVAGKPGNVKLTMSVGLVTWIEVIVETLGSVLELPA